MTLRSTLGGAPSDTWRIAPGVVTTLTAPAVLGIRPYRRGTNAVPGVWEAMVDDHRGAGPVTFLTQGPRVATFLQSYCTFTQARWAGQPLVLMTWQKATLVEAFELAYDDERDEFVRRYHEVMLETPKKNGKSELVAGLSHYFLAGDDEPSPIVICAAANDVSANLVFRPAKSMVDLCDSAQVPGRLEEWCDAWEDRIILRGQPNAMILRVPASPRATEGLNIANNFMDEWHEWTTPAAEQTATKLLNGTVLRPRYMNWRTTTPGWDIESLCGQDHEWGVAVAEREVEASEWFFRCYSAPDLVERNGRMVPLDWRSRDAVELSNPSFGQLMDWPFYENKLRRDPEATYSRYFLGRWTAGEASWLPFGAWEACELPGLTLVPDEETFVAIDASFRNDGTAVTAIQCHLAPHPETRELVPMVDALTWIWERPLDPHTRKPKEGWIVPADEVEALLVELARDYRVRQFEYDPTFFREVAIKLLNAGFPMHEFSQNNLRNMTEACQQTYQRVMARGLRHRGDDERAPGAGKFTAHIKAAVAVQAATGAAAWTLRKGKAKRKMDGAMSLVMAVWASLHPEEGPKGPVEVHFGTL